MGGPSGGVTSIWMEPPGQGREAAGKRTEKGAISEACEREDTQQSLKCRCSIFIWYLLSSKFLRSVGIET